MIEIKINILKKFSKNPPKTLEPYVPMTPNKDTTCSYSTYPTNYSNR